MSSDTLGQILVAALVLGNTALALRINRRGKITAQRVEETHTLVNAQHTDSVNRETQLTTAITDAGNPVPERLPPTEVS